MKLRIIFWLGFSLVLKELITRLLSLNVVEVERRRVQIGREKISSTLYEEWFDSISYRWVETGLVTASLKEIETGSGENDDDVMRADAKAYLQKRIKQNNSFLNQFHDSCAVVGSSSGLLHGNAGMYIDSHSITLRGSIAVTKGYESDVGTRTTARFGAFRHHPSVENDLYGRIWIKEGNESIVFFPW